MNKVFNKVIIATVFLNPSMGLGEKAQPPEVELATAKTDLANLQRKIDSLVNLHSRNGLGPDKVSAQNALKKAKDFFAQQDLYSAVREGRKFLLMSQSPQIEDYLEVQYILGSANDKIGNKAQAARAYFHYLSGSITTSKPDMDKIVSVLKRVVSLSIFDSETNKLKLNQTLSSINALPLTETVKAHVLYLSGKAAYNTNQPKLAKMWLNEAISQKASLEVSAKAHYFAALIDLKANMRDSAQKHLKEILEIQTTQDLHDLAVLALARLSLENKNYSVAESYYNRIKEDSSVYRDALYESIHTSLKLNQSKLAIERSEKFINRYPALDKTYKIQTLLALLDLKNGDLEKADQRIKSTDEKLEKIQKWIDQNITNKRYISYQDIQNILKNTQSTIKATKSVDESFQLFSAIAKLRSRMQQSRSELFDAQYIMGKSTLQSVTPEWSNRLKSLDVISRKLLNTAHRIINTERLLYTSNLDEITQRKLNFSQKKRFDLNSPLFHQKLDNQNWKTVINHLDYVKKIAKAHERVQQLKAEMNAFAYNANNSTEFGSTSKLQNLQKRALELEKKNFRFLELSRKDQVHNILQKSSFLSLKQYFRLYALHLNEESHYLKPIRNSFNTNTDRILKIDFSEFWRQWRFLAESFYTKVQSTETAINHEIGEHLKSIDQKISMHDALISQLDKITLNLESQIGQKSEFIANQYQKAIRERIAKHNKWKADLEWIKYQRTSSKELQLSKKFELEEQILQETYEQTNQGANLP